MRYYLQGLRFELWISHVFTLNVYESNHYVTWQKKISCTIYIVVLFNYDIKHQNWSKSPRSTDKCRNCKVERHDPGLNPGPHSCVWVYFQWITTSSKKKKTSKLDNNLDD